MVNCLSFSNSGKRAKKLLKTVKNTSWFVISGAADLFLQQTYQVEIIKLELQLKSLSRQVICPKYL